jgi:hypothetical protein
MSLVERLVRDMRDVAFFDRALKTMGTTIVGDLVQRHPELRRIAALWAEAVAGEIAAAGARRTGIARHRRQRRRPG